MHLKSVKRTHFRGYCTPTVIPIDAAMTGIVGSEEGHRLCHESVTTF